MPETIKFKGLLVEDRELSRRIRGTKGREVYIPKSVFIYFRKDPPPAMPAEVCNTQGMRLCECVFSLEPWKAKEIEQSNIFDQE